MSEKKYIDAEQLWEEIDNEDIYTDFESACIFKMMREKINNAPKADVEEVKHGKWKDGYCTNCGTSKFAMQIIRGYATVYEYEGEANYCPNCGAKMDKE